jgi:hypothetical protein
VCACMRERQGVRLTAVEVHAEGRVEEAVDGAVCKRESMREKKRWTDGQTD